MRVARYEEWQSGWRYYTLRRPGNNQPRWTRKAISPTPGVGARRSRSKSPMVGLAGQQCTLPSKAQRRALPTVPRRGRINVDRVRDAQLISMTDHEDKQQKLHLSSYCGCHLEIRSRSYGSGRQLRMRYTILPSGPFGALWGPAVPIFLQDG